MPKRAPFNPEIDLMEKNDEQPKQICTLTNREITNDQDNQSESNMKNEVTRGHCAVVSKKTISVGDEKTMQGAER